VELTTYYTPVYFDVFKIPKTLRKEEVDTMYIHGIEADQWSIF
jgi:hypothetical protein